MENFKLMEKTEHAEPSNGLITFRKNACFFHFVNKRLYFERSRKKIVSNPPKTSSMRPTVLIILLILTSCNVFSQENPRKIKVSEDIQLIRLSENAYVHVSVSTIPPYGKVASNGLIFINKDEAFLFDTPVTDGLTKTLVLWLSSNLGLKIVGFVPNHWHGDCMGGLGYLKSQKVKSYANQMTIDIARSKKLPV
jgi:metallo-beta-lactamase class B